MNSHADIHDCAIRLIERQSKPAAESEEFCERCGLSALHPHAELNDDHICRICRIYEDEADRAQAYFRTMDDLRQIVTDAKSAATGNQDCMMLLSGGKDSTYALCQLVALGLKPLVFTLDNGYISEGAKANIQRVVDQLGLELIIGTTPAMNEIFVDSLHRFSNVCNGCFKTIYTLTMNIARERSIRHIFTGLSRGQIFETRVADLFRQRIFDPNTIDRTIIDARKAYHRANDAVLRLLDTRHFRDDTIFEEIKFVDFYRYTDVSLDDMLSYLREQVPWVRPADTGRSTNCLINEAGIYVHKKERGYHNYALPYSWDVRLGHKNRDAARDELDDDINTESVHRILSEIGYTPRETEHRTGPSNLLVGYYVADVEIDSTELKAMLGEQLPADLIPAQFVRLDQLPLTRNGKIDRSALPEPETARPQLGEAYVAPNGQIEKTLTVIWSQILGFEKIGVNDNFFDLGGDSIMNIQIVALAGKHGLRLSPQQIFDQPTIRELVTVVGTADEVASQQGPVTGAVALTPAQHRFFERALSDNQSYCQYVVIESSAPLDVLILQEALRQLCCHHDALRSRFAREDGVWQQSIDGTEQAHVPLSCVDIADLERDAVEAMITSQASRLQSELDPLAGRLLRVVAFDGGHGKGKSRLLMLAHHLIVDAVSWWILVEDLDHAYRSLASGSSIRMPAKTTSVRHWSQALQTYASSEQAASTLPFWLHDVRGSGDKLPSDPELSQHNDLQSSETVSVALSERYSNHMLTEAMAKWRVQPQDIVLAALLTTLTSWSEDDTLTVDVEGHGREVVSDEIDLLRTVGWFTTVYPVRLSKAPQADAGELLRHVRDQLRAIPKGGIAYGTLRYLSADTETRNRLQQQAQAEVLFNYLGKWRRSVSDDATLCFARPVMASYGSNGQRLHAFEINAAVFDGRLITEWTYSRNLHKRKTIQSLTETFRENLQALIAYCCSHRNAQYSPSDFPTADLSEEELDDILADFGEK